MLLALLLAALPAAAAPIAWPDVAAPLAASRAGARDAALVVGVERYATVPPVPGAAENAKDWYAYLTKVRGVPVGSTRLLLDNEGTLEKLRKHAAEAAARVKPGGTLWFVFVGHGAPAADGKDGILVGFDAQQDPDSLYARSLPQRELLALLGNGKQAHTIALVDACFSGRTASGAALAPGLQPLLPVASAAPAKATVLSAGRADQFAGPLPGAERPAFSYLVLGALRGWGDADGNGKVTAREAVAYAEEALRSLQSDRTQTPEVHGPGADAALAAGAKEAGPDLAALVLERRGGRKAPAPTPAPPTGAVERFVLGNGLTVLVDPTPGAAEVAVVVLHRAGAAADPAGQAGRAHLVEHLMFQGTGEGGKPFADSLSALSKSWNGTTSEDALRLWEVVPGGSLEAALRLEALRLGRQHERIDATTFAAQKEVVEAEAARSPAGGYDAVTELLFPPGHPYRGGALGTKASRAAIAQPAVAAALARTYAPANAVLAISGDVRPAEVRALVERRRGALAPGVRLPPVTPTRVGLASSRDVVLELPGSEPAMLELTWPGAALGTADDAALDVLSAWLRSHGGPLTQRVREELGLTYAVSAWNTSALLGGRFVISAKTAPENLDRLGAELEATLAKATPTQAAVDEAKRTVIATVRGNGSPLTRALLLANAELLGAPVEPARWFETWEAVTLADVQRVLRQYLAGKPRIALRTLRKADAPPAGRLVR